MSRASDTEEKYENALAQAGLYVDQQGQVSPYAASKTPVAPTWEAMREAQERNYDAEIRLIELRKLGEMAVDAVAGVHERINSKINPEIASHSVLANELRTIEETVLAAGVRVTARYADNGQGCQGFQGCRR